MKQFNPVTSGGCRLAAGDVEYCGRAAAWQWHGTSLAVHTFTDNTSSNYVLQPCPSRLANAPLLQSSTPPTPFIHAPPPLPDRSAASMGHTAHVQFALV
ncbi:hypothetical protein J6590_017107 [Homalodisca vitripennis]|nr:hypothetical protein J6590_017107 [Homalodisca vitripennis]